MIDENLTVKRKFNIDEFLFNLPYNQAVKARLFLPELCGVTRQTFGAWRTATLCDKIDIPSKAFLKLCVFFNVPPAELVNYQFDSAMFSTSDAADINNIINKLGLTV